MLDLLRSEKGLLKVEMHRPEPLDIKISKKGNPLGLNISIQEDSANSKTLFLSGIQDGAAKDYNTNSSGPVVQVSDVIISVNGVNESAAAMLKVLKESDDVNVTIVRSPA